MNPAINYGTYTDPRDRHTYKTVTIGTQTWMAQNLNYTPLSGNFWCYNDSAIYCITYGLLYDYHTAITACPTGWNLPDTTAWNTLEATVGGTSVASIALMSTTGWNVGTGDTAGTNDYGFSALPAGIYFGTTFIDIGNYGYWWTATASGSTNAWSRGIYIGAGVDHGINVQTDDFSIRCVKSP